MSTAPQLELEDAIPDPMIEVTYKFPQSQQRVHDAAHEMISETMNRGALSNGLNTWINKPGLLHHFAKGLIHITRVQQVQSLESRERDDPHMLDLFNGVTRFCMAWALHKMSKNLRETVKHEPHPESIDE